MEPHAAKSWSAHGVNTEHNRSRQELTRSHLSGFCSIVDVCQRWLQSPAFDLFPTKRSSGEQKDIKSNNMGDETLIPPLRVRSSLRV